MNQEDNNELLKKSFDTMDVELLKKAISLGANVNYKNKFGIPLLPDLVYDWGALYNDGDEPFKTKDIFEFTQVLLDNGYDLNASWDDVGTVYTLFFDTAKWSHSIEYLEFLFKNGLNPNIIGENASYSQWDEIYSDIFAEECCDCPEEAKYLYNICRISIAYGAKPIDLIRPTESPDEWRIKEMALNLDDEELAKLSPEEIIGNDLSHVCTYFSKFYYGKEFYYDNKAFQRRLIKTLKVLIDKIGVETLSSHCLDDLVEDQHDKVLGFLIKEGVNPNQNCFTESYRWVKSSALYEIESRGYQYEPAIRDKMKEILLSAGAIVK